MSARPQTIAAWVICETIEIRKRRRLQTKLPTRCLTPFNLFDQHLLRHNDTRGNNNLRCITVTNLSKTPNFLSAQGGCSLFTVSLRTRWEGWCRSFFFIVCLFGRLARVVLVFRGGSKWWEVLPELKEEERALCQCCLVYKNQEVHRLLYNTGLCNDT